MKERERRRESLQLSRRERQIMEIVYARNGATAEEVLQGLPDPPGYSAVRALLAILERKGYLRHEKQGRRFVFRPTVDRKKAAREAGRKFLHTYFEDSLELAVSALLDSRDAGLDDEEYRKLIAMIEEAWREGGTSDA
jgi:BlaI family penicillinase repressor